MQVKQPKLPYSHDHLEPQISAETLQFHHGKHHMAYFNKLKELAEKDNSLATQKLEDIVASASGVTFNQAAQIYNHSFYWHCMRSNKERKENTPTGEIAKMIERDFGSFEKFKEQFTTAAGTHFGSGWVFLIQKSDGKLEVMGAHDADCPLKGNRGRPIICCDVWEHAFYIDYRNAKPEYLKNWWDLVNWDFANKNLKEEFCYDKAN